MTDGNVERLNYFQRQFLGAEDFTDQQEYHRSMRRRHNLAHHTWGIVAGLELFTPPQEGRTGTGAQVDAFLLPGMAVDGFGREIFVFTPRKIDFGNDPPPTSSARVDVWVGYTEEPASLAGECGNGEEHPASPQSSCARTTIAGFELPGAGSQYSRVSERYRIYLMRRAPYHNQIILDGEEIDTDDLSDNTPEAAEGRQELAPYGIYPDETVPHQELPDDAGRPQWLVRVGTLTWDGTSFVEDLKETAAYKKLLKEGRKYVGAVASELLAADGMLRIRDRTTDPLRTMPPDPATDPGVEVDLEGQMRVHRLLTAKKDVQVHGGMLDFRETDGANLRNGNAYPTTMRRKDLGLEVTAGRKKQGTDPISHFKVGFDDNNNFGPVLSVENTGKVDITGNLDVSGTLSLGGVLDIADALGDRLVLWGNAEDQGAAAFGTEENGDTLYHKANARHRWYIQKNRDDGASEKMSLDAARLRLTLPLRMEKEIDFEAVSGDLVMLDGPINLANSSGLGFETGTLYARANQRHRWFVGALANSGAQVMELDAAQLTVNRNLFVNNANVGIGTNPTPGARLRVSGGLRVGDQGSIINNLQGGTTVLGQGNNTADDFQIAFPTGFIGPGLPRVIVVPRAGDATVPDAFAATVISVANNQFIVRVIRLDAAGGWGQALELDWIAWK